MSNTLSIRLSKELATWLQKVSSELNLSQGSFVREQLEKARANSKKPYMELAGTISKDPKLSLRKGFSKK